MRYKSASYALQVTTILLSFAAAGWVNAQDANSPATDRQLLACDAIEDTTDRLECFNSIVESLRHDNSATFATEPTEAPPAVRDLPDDTTTPAAAVPESAAASDADGLTGSAAIVRVWQNLDGRFSVELDNGQVWRETEASRVGMPKVGRTVKISRGVFGSYRMKIDGIPREARVRRTPAAL